MMKINPKYLPFLFNVIAVILLNIVVIAAFTAQNTTDTNNQLPHLSKTKESSITLNTTRLLPAINEICDDKRFSMNTKNDKPIIMETVGEIYAGTCDVIKGKNNVNLEKHKHKLGMLLFVARDWLLKTILSMDILVNKSAKMGGNKDQSLPKYKNSKKIQVKPSKQVPIPTKNAKSDDDVQIFDSLQQLTLVTNTLFHVVVKEKILNSQKHFAELQKCTLSFLENVARLMGPEFSTQNLIHITESMFCKRSDNSKLCQSLHEQEQKTSDNHKMAPPSSPGINQNKTGCGKQNSKGSDNKIMKLFTHVQRRKKRATDDDSDDSERDIITEKERRRKRLPAYADCLSKILAMVFMASAILGFTGFIQKTPLVRKIGLTIALCSGIAMVVILVLSAIHLRLRIKKKPDIEKAQDSDENNYKDKDVAEIIKQKMVKLPVNSYEAFITVLENYGDGEGITNCSVCLEEFERHVPRSKKFIVRGECGHLFHSACVMKWFIALSDHPVCPVCGHRYKGIWRYGYFNDYTTNERLELLANEEIDYDYPDDTRRRLPGVEIREIGYSPSPMRTPNRSSMQSPARSRSPFANRSPSMTPNRSPTRSTVQNSGNRWKSDPAMGNGNSHPIEVTRRGRSRVRSAGPAYARSPSPAVMEGHEQYYDNEELYSHNSQGIEMQRHSPRYYSQKAKGKAKVQDDMQSPSDFEQLHANYQWSRPRSRTAATTWTQFGGDEVEHNQFEQGMMSEPTGHYQTGYNSNAPSVREQASTSSFNQKESKRTAGRRSGIHSEFENGNASDYHGNYSQKLTTPVEMYGNSELDGGNYAHTHYQSDYHLHHNRSPSRFSHKSSPNIGLNHANERYFAYEPHVWEQEQAIKGKHGGVQLHPENEIQEEQFDGAYGNDFAAEGIQSEWKNYGNNFAENDGIRHQSMNDDRNNSEITEEWNQNAHFVDDWRKANINSENGAEIGKKRRNKKRNKNREHYDYQTEPGGPAESYWGKSESIYGGGGITEVDDNYHRAASGVANNVHNDGRTRERLHGRKKLNEHENIQNNNAHDSGGPNFYENETNANTGDEGNDSDVFPFLAQQDERSWKQ